MNELKPTCLTTENIHKQFPGVLALNQVSFEVNGGEIHALLGANGAGKSTLVKILSGAYLADSGSIRINNELLTIQNPRDAMEQGIYCVYQEVDTVLVQELTVAENVMLNRMVNGKQFIHWKKLRKEAAHYLSLIGADFPVTLKVEELTISQKQLVIIARAVAQQAKFVIFDEPTAPLSLEEAKRLFQVIQTLKEQGVGCIFISHRLDEVFEICDRATIMRDGQRIVTKDISETSINEVIETMLGKTFSEEFPKIEKQIGDVLLEVDQLHQGTKVRGASFQLRRGEILGIVGLVGAGKTELSRLLFAADRPDGGSIKLNGRVLQLKEPRDAVREGIVLVPEERRKQGILVEESVAHNLSLSVLQKFSSPIGLIRRLSEKKHAESMVKQLGVATPNTEQLLKYLSGGNQQKVAVGKWLPTDAEVFLFDEPTKGVDIGAKSDIFRLIGNLAKEGKGVIYFSCEISEIIGIADRVIVMSYGQMTKEMPIDEATQDNILYYASLGEAQTV